jgi:hypothetical protein
MNILEIEDIIKGLPDQSLMQEAQAPSGQMPQFLVVSEIQRRADMRKRFQNQQQEMPQGTIAQQIVQGGIASMGNRQPIQPMPPQGMPPQGMPPMPQQGMPQGMPQQGMPMQQQPPMMPPMSPPMMPPAQGMAAGGVVRMQGGTQTPYTGGTKAYQNLIDQALMAGGTSRDIEALIRNNPEAQAVYNSMRGPNPQTASIPYGEEFDGRKAVVGGSPGYTPYYLSNSVPNTQGATSDSIRSQNQRQQNKLEPIRNQTDGESILNLERFSRMKEMNSPNYSLVGSGFGFNPQENLSNRNENVPAQQARSPSIGSSVLMDELAKVLTKEETQRFPYTGGTGLTEYGQNLFSQGLGEGQTVEEIVRNIYNYRPSTTATARGSRRDPDQPSTEEYIKSIYGDDFSTPGLYSGMFRGPGAESLYMEEVMGRIGGSVPVTESPIPSPLATDDQGSATETLSTGETPSLESLLQYKSPLSFGDNYNIENPLNMDSNRFYETTINKDPKDLAPIISLGLSDRTAEDKVAEDLMKRPQGPDYSAAKSILDELQAVDYSAFKPDYAGLITEQERRAQKIRDDASKDASAQALIQLGAGLAAGDISKGLSAAGQSVADIKRQARAEARDEEGFARQLRLAQDEAGMQLGLKQAEAEISIQLERAGLNKGEADALANAKVRAYEFKQEFGLKESELAAGIRRDIMTSGNSSLSALIEQWKDLADAATEEDIAERNNLANQIKVLIKEQKFLRDELRGSLNADSSPNTVATAPKQNEKKDTDVIEAARSLLGNR